MKHLLCTLPLILFPVYSQVVDTQSVLNAALDEVQAQQSENLGPVITAVLDASGGDEQAYWQGMQKAVEAGHPVALTWKSQQMQNQLRATRQNPETAPEARRIAPTQAVL